MNDQTIETKITQALDSYPQADPPLDFVSKVMAQVEAVPQDAKLTPIPVLQISFLPAALGVFVVVFIGVLIWVSRMLMDQINPLLIAYYQNLFQYWRMRLTVYDIPAPSIYIVLTAIVAATYWLVYTITNPHQKNA